MAEIEKTDEELIDDWLTHPGYQLICDEYKNMVYQTQSELLERAQTWDMVLQARGYCNGLSELVNLKANRELLAAAALEEKEWVDAHKEGADEESI